MQSYKQWHASSYTENCANFCISRCVRFIAKKCNYAVSYVKDNAKEQGTVVGL